MPEGVYYREQDYAGVWRRLFTDLVDIPVLLVLIAAAWIGLSKFLSGELGAAALILVAAGLSCLYLVLLKRSRVRTLGYRLAGVRVVDLHGGVPSVASMTLRLLFAVFGPLNILLDLFWIPGNLHRQALRRSDSAATLSSAGASYSKKWLLPRPRDGRPRFRTLPAMQELLPVAS